MISNRKDLIKKAAEKLQKKAERKTPKSEVPHFTRTVGEPSIAYSAVPHSESLNMEV